MFSMSTKKLCVGLIIYILVFPGNVALAKNDSDTLELLTHQITALEKYIARTNLRMGLSEAVALPREDMRDVIKNGVAWLVEAQEGTGHFAYEYLPYSDEYKYGDNIVRQAGALYALTEVARRDAVGDMHRSAAIEEAVVFFENASLAHTYEGKEVRCLARNKDSKTCILGATALALAGVLGYVESDPAKASTYEHLIEGYISFIMASKKEAAGFRDQYRIGTGFVGDKESSFSNGEALLALVRYYQYSPDQEVKRIIDETFSYLEVIPFDTPLYLWAMAALKDMHALWPSEKYTTYGEKFTAWRMGSLYRSHGTTRNYCASTEGLASAYTLIEDSASKEVLERLRTEIDFWNLKNVDLQITSNDLYRLATREDGTIFLEFVQNLNKSRGGFLTAENELTQRIDFTQHCVSTYVQTLVDIDGQLL